MDRLIYTALTGMNAAMDRQRVIANNLANSSTPGFRQEAFAVTPATLRDGSLEARAMAQGVVRGVDMTQGRVVTTGQPLDMAVRGDALIAFQAPDGGEIYSRRGDLRIAPSGLLENGEGLPVIGQAGPITVPAGSKVALGNDGSVLVSDPADPAGEPQVLDRIKLASPEGSAIAKGIDSFLRVPDGGVLPADPTAEITPGALEASNVETASTLVEMIEAQRSFEQRAKVISTASELDEAGARLMSMR